MAVQHPGCLQSFYTRADPAQAPDEDQGDVPRLAAASESRLHELPPPVLAAVTPPHTPTGEPVWFSLEQQVVQSGTLPCDQDVI